MFDGVLFFLRRVIENECNGKAECLSAFEQSEQEIVSRILSDK